MIIIILICFEIISNFEIKKIISISDTNLNSNDINQNDPLKDQLNIYVQNEIELNDLKISKLSTEIKIDIQRFKEEKETKEESKDGEASQLGPKPSSTDSEVNESIKELNNKVETLINIMKEKNKQILDLQKQGKLKYKALTDKLAELDARRKVKLLKSQMITKTASQISNIEKKINESNKLETKAKSSEEQIKKLIEETNKETEKVNKHVLSIDEDKQNEEKFIKESPETIKALEEKLKGKKSVELTKSMFYPDWVKVKPQYQIQILERDAKIKDIELMHDRIEASRKSFNELQDAQIHLVGETSRSKQLIDGIEKMPAKPLVVNQNEPNKYQ